MVTLEGELDECVTTDQEEGMKKRLYTPTIPVASCVQLSPALKIYLLIQIKSVEKHTRHLLCEVMKTASKGVVHHFHTLLPTKAFPRVCHVV